MRIPSRKLNTAHLTANDEALRRCRKALQFRDRGDFDGAQEVMSGLWEGLGQRPKIAGLHPTVAPEVLLTVGVLTGWIGSRNEVKEADGWARDLITESMTLYESLGDLKKVAESRSELACCYWREGAFDDARIMFKQALQRLTIEGNARANALIGLAVVEWSSSREAEALRILTKTKNVKLFDKITNPTIKGFYHNTLAMVLRKFVRPNNKAPQLWRVANHYEEADHYFKLAHNTIFRAMVKNNIGNVLLQLSRFGEAHEYLDHARRLAVSLRDKVRTAQIDLTRAEAMIAEERFQEADKIARLAAVSFEKAGRRCLLVDALINRGIALARLHKTQEAQFTFQRAIEVAQQVGASNNAGIAALSMIEELDDLSPETLRVAYKRANEWLADSQSPELLRRINAAATIVFSKVESEALPEDTDVLLNKPLDFEREKLKTEKAMIKRALALADGSVTRAASLLSMTHQKLAYIIDTRHRDLLPERSPIHRRPAKRSRG